MVLHKIGSVANARSPECPLSAEVRRAFEWFIQHVLSGPPRVISCDSCETSYSFLDGVCFLSRLQRTLGVQLPWVRS